MNKLNLHLGKFKISECTVYRIFAKFYYFKINNHFAFKLICSLRDPLMGW